MPFLTEEVWHWTGERQGHSEDLCVTAWPERTSYDKEILTDIDVAKEVVTAIRNIRNDNGIPNKEALELKVQKGDGYPVHLEPWIAHLTNVQDIEHVQDKVKGEEKAAAAFILCDTCRERNIREEVDPEMGP